MYDTSRTGQPPSGVPRTPTGWPVSPSPVPYRRAPSGLLPNAASRPVYREALPVRAGMVVLGAGAAAVWMLLCGVMPHTARGYCWWTIGGGVVGWAVALVLARFGDRGVAAGVAMSTAIGVAIAMGIVVDRWIGGHWLLW